MADRVFSYLFTGNFTSLQAGLTSATRNVSDLSSKMTALDKDGAQMRAGLTKVGDTAGKIGLVAAASLGAATKAAIDWESQWAGVQKTVDGTAQQMAVLEDELRGLARTMPATHREIAATAEAAGQLGVAREDVTAFTKTMIQLGETTNLTADEAATSFARFANIMGTPTSEVDRMGAAVVGLGNNFATTEAEVVALSTRLAAAGRQAGLTEADVFGIAAALTSVGVEAEAGGTAMSKVFTSIGDSVRAGGEDLDTFAGVAGVTADEFQRIFENDPSQAIGQFVEGMGGIAREGGNTSAIFKELGLTDSRLMRAVLSVGQATGSWGEAVGMANDEYEKNAALTDEYAKRAETTGAKATVALNNIRDAGIELGDTLLPVFAKGAEGVASFAQAIGGLPGPVKNVTGGLLGITAILGGGLWFGSKVVSGIASTKQALDDLGISADRTKGSLGAVAKSATGLAVVATIGAGIGSAVAEISGANLELEDLARNLDAVANGIDNKALGQIVDDLRIVGDRNFVDNFGEVGAEILTLNGAFGTFSTTLDAAQSDIQATDLYLAGLVESGSGEKAAAIFEAIVAELNGLPAGASLSQEALDGVIDKFGSYETALGNASATGDGVASQGEEIAGSLDEVGGAAGEAAEEVASLADVLSALLTPKLDLAAASDEWAAGLRNVSDSLAKGNKSLVGNTDAAQKNREAIRGQVSNLLSLVDAQAETGAGTKQLEGQMRRGYDAIINAGKAAGLSEDQMRDYLKTLGLTPKEIKTLVKAMTAEADAALDKTQGKANQLDRTTANPKVTAATSAAQAAIQGIWNALTNLDGKTATTYVTTRRIGQSPGFGPTGSADGSTVPDDGGTYADRFLYLLAPGEEIISNRNGQADRNRPLLKAINAGRLADGGTAGGSRSRATGVPSDMYAWSDAVDRSRRGLEAELRVRSRLLAKELSASKERLDAYKSERDSIISTVAARLTTENLFGQVARPGGFDFASNTEGLTPEQIAANVAAQNSVNASLGFNKVTSPADILRADIARAKEEQALIRKLKSRGLSGSALEAAITQDGGLEGAASLSRTELKQFERLYDRRDMVVGNASAEAGNAVYGRAIKEQTAEVRALRMETRDTNRRLERLEKLAEKAPRETGSEVGKAVNGAAAGGQRRRQG